MSTTSESSSRSGSTSQSSNICGHQFCCVCEEEWEECECSCCAICDSKGEDFIRLHCARCLLPCCKSCCSFKRYVRLFDRTSRIVCDSCGVRSGLTALSEFPPFFISSAFFPTNNAKSSPSLQSNSCGPLYSSRGLRWGLYVLRCAAELPRRCIMSHDSFTSFRECRKCSNPTVPTSPQESHTVKLSNLSKNAADSLRDTYSGNKKVISMTDTEKAMSVLHPFLEDKFCFHALSDPLNILLAIGAIEISYEYSCLSNVSMSLSSWPYTHFLSLDFTGSGFSMLRGPGKKIFVAIPGTHNARTGILNMNLEFIPRELTLPKNFKFPYSGTKDIIKTNDDAYLDSKEKIHWRFLVHKGFSDEEQTINVPLKRFLKWIFEENYEIIFCGHSQGGAIAALMTLRLLEMYAASAVSPSPSGRPLTVPISCIQVGAPPIGDASLQKCVEACGWSPCFHSIVLPGDMVPYSLLTSVTSVVNFGIQLARAKVLQLTSNPLVKMGLSLVKESFFSVPVDSSRHESKREGVSWNKNENEAQSKSPSVSSSDQSRGALYQIFGYYHFLFRGNDEEYICSKDPVTVRELLLEKAVRHYSNRHALSSYRRAVLEHVCNRPLWCAH